MKPLSKNRRGSHLTSTIVNRRPHKKSRTGCLPCKTRRIKCGEEKPSCCNCMLKSQTCEYPSPRLNPIKYRFQNETTTPSPSSPTPSMSLATNTFTLKDLRLFHHFLNYAYPSLPLGNQSIWVRDVPQLIYEHEHLMHALLALGASHMSSLTLGTSDTDQDKFITLAHKGRAMSGLRKAFACQDHSAVELDAMLATCYALAFQAALTTNGSLDFSVFIRGCGMVTQYIQDGSRSTIFNLSTDPSRCPTRPTANHDHSFLDFTPQPRLKDLLSLGIESLASAQQDMTQHEAERNFYLAIRATFLGLERSPAAGYAQFLSFYAVWYKLAEDSLQFAVDLVCHTAQMLWAFFMGLQLLILLLVHKATIDNGVHQRRGRPHISENILSKINGMLEWLQAISMNIPTSLRQHVEWPQTMSGEVSTHLSLPDPEPAKVQKKLETLQNLDIRTHIVLGSILDLSAALTNWTEERLAASSSLDEMDRPGRVGRQAHNFVGDTKDPRRKPGPAPDLIGNASVQIPGNCENECRDSNVDLDTDLAFDVVDNADSFHFHSRLNSMTSL